MAQTRRFTTGERRRRALGVASLVISGPAGTLLLLLLFVARFLERVGGPRMGALDAPGLGLVVGFLALGCVLSIVAALVVAAVALSRPGRGWPAAAAGWMVGASALCLAGAQAGVWTKGPEVRSADGMALEESGGTRWEEPAPDVGAGGRPPAGPPDAVLTSARRDAIGFEGAFCWAPEWAENCVEDAGIPLPPEQEAIAVRRGETADLVFVLRASEGEFSERSPVPTGAVGYPLGQEAKTAPAAPMGVRYLVPDGGSRALEKQGLDLKREGRATGVVADVPEGEYVFRVTARPPEGVESWVEANYHFRVLVLGKDD